MKVEAAIAMLQALPPGTEVDLAIRSVVTPGAQPKAPRRSAGRWSNTTPEERRAAAQKASEARWQRMRQDASLSHGDASVDASLTDGDASGADGGNQGGSGSEKAETSGKETGISGSSPTGQDRGARDGDATMRQVTHAPDASSHDASSAKKRASRSAPKFPIPDPFLLTAGHREYAAGKGWPSWWLEDRHEQFCSLAVAKSWRYADWTQAFYTYLRNEVGWGRGHEQLSYLAPKGAPHPVTRTADAEAARAKAAEVEARMKARREAERGAQ